METASRFIMTIKEQLELQKKFDSGYFRKKNVDKLSTKKPVKRVAKKKAVKVSE